MKRILNHLLTCLMMAALLPMSFSCTDPNGPGTNPEGELFEGTVILGQAPNSSARKIISSDMPWFVGNSNTWFSVSPLQGDIGDTEIGILAVTANEDIFERVGFFTINNDKHWVVQRGISSINVEKKEMLVVPEQKEVLIPFNTTYSLDEIKVSYEADWIEYVSIDKTKETVLLEDGVTYSNYNEAAVRLSVLVQNTTGESRRAVVKITVGEEKFEVSLVQLTQNVGEVDFLAEFFRTSVFYKATSVGCGYCPLMTKALEPVEEKYPDRFLEVTCYGYMNTYDTYMWEGVNDILAHYQCTGFPDGYFNGIARLQSSGVLSAKVEEMIVEAIREYPASVAIAAESKVSGGNIKIDLKLAAKESNDYMLTVYFLENGLVSYQSDYSNILPDPNNFEHNNVLRGTATDGYVDGGDKIELPLGEVVNKTIEVALPKSIENIDNVDVLIYVSYPGGPAVQTVGGVSYKEYGYVIDNAVKIPAKNGKADFKYEK